ncbi:GyrI-like domain-containing protein [Methylobacterium sp. 88A]|uniref:GyrI-like domain-containing protein n=1 Tax=Methylobacterium sp. 88A TaxID=1131813 RepID=UPI0003AAE1D6|nr:GyrI-like domain-containing protein [Methylobacterium sp. 88A]
MTRHRLLPLVSLAAALAVSSALAQQPSSPATSSPLPTTTAPDPVNPDAPSRPVPTQALPAAPALTPGSSRPTLVETPGDANDVDEVSLPPKPAAILAGRASWEEAVPALKAAFVKIEEALAKDGITPAGRPLAVFAKTDDDGFQFEAMIPIASMPNPKPAETGGLRFGTTPSGKALRFPHKGSYDEIDGTYETLTAYLDAKDVVVQDRFIEEYVTDLNDKADEKLDVNIYALPK